MVLRNQELGRKEELEARTSSKPEEAIESVQRKTQESSLAKLLETY